MNEQMAAAILAFAAFTMLGWLWFSPGGVLSLYQRAGAMQVDIRFAYGPGTLYQLLEAYGAAGRESFRRLLLIDMVFPAIYAATLCVFADWLGGGTRAAVAAQTAAICAAAFDYTENLLLLSILRHFPARHDLQARFASLSTSLKALSTGTAVAAFFFM